MATPKKKTTPKQSKTAGKTRQVKATTEGECNPCFQQSAGFLTCDGSSPVVVPFPATGEWVVVVKNGQLILRNVSEFENVDAVEPSPTDPELDPPDTEPIPASQLPPPPAPE